MKTITRLTLFALLLITATACQKDVKISDNENPPNNANKVKTYIEEIDWTSVGSYAKDTGIITYDNQNRISKIYWKGDKEITEQYVYETGRYYYEYYYGTNLIRRNTFYLNSQKLVDSAVEVDSQMDTMLTKYVYNANKQLVEERVYWANYPLPPTIWDTIRYTYDANGLLNEKVEDLYETTYKYDKVINNTADVGKPYMYRQKQLPTQSITNSHGVYLSTTNYNYELDAQNRVIKEASNQDNQLKINKFYTY